MVVELDGGQHDKQALQNNERTEYINKFGYRVLRYWNNEVLSNVDGVLADICSSLKEPD